MRIIILLYLIFTLGSIESRLYMNKLQNQSTFQSANTETNFLLLDDGQFRSGPPTNNNNNFEVVSLKYSIVGLRAVNSTTHPQQRESGESDTAPEETQAGETQAEEGSSSDCYLGFNSDGVSACYRSEDPEARFLIFPLY